MGIVMKIDPLTNLSNICMKLMDLAAEDEHFGECVRMGHLAFCAYMASGIKAIAELKYDYANMKLRYKLEHEDNERVRGLLKEVFGDEDIDSVRDDVKEDILNYAKAKLKELYGEDEEDEQRTETNQRP